MDGRLVRFMGTVGFVPVEKQIMEQQWRLTCAITMVNMLRKQKLKNLQLSEIYSSAQEVSVILAVLHFT